jgi:hypothetical protein
MSEEEITLDEDRKATYSNFSSTQAVFSSVYQYYYFPRYKIKEQQEE